MKTVMKVTVGFLLAAALPLALCAEESVKERPAYGYGMGGGYGPGMMQGRGWGQGMMRGGTNADEEYQPIPEKEAKMIFEKYIADYLKGYKIMKVEKQRVPMGTMYWAIVKDAGGNEFELHLNPFGQVRGPFVR